MNLLRLQSPNGFYLLNEFIRRITGFLFYKFLDRRPGCKVSMQFVERPLKRKLKCRSLYFTKRESDAFIFFVNQLSFLIPIRPNRANVEIFDQGINVRINGEQP